MGTTDTNHWGETKSALQRLGEQVADANST